MHTIRLFMWGYQLHFQVGVQVAAEALFGELDPELEVETFLVGLRQDEDPEKHLVCLEPEDCGFLPEQFTDARTQAAHFRAIDPDSQILHSHPIAQESHDRRLDDRSLRNAILKVVKGWRSEDREFYCSALMPVAGYDVAVVLQIGQTGERPHYVLPKVHSEDRYGTPHSLLESAIREFLADCAGSLDTRDPQNVSRYTGRGAAELLRAAGARLMDAPIWAAGNIDGLYGLFETCNVISSMRYEGGEVTGKLLIARAGHPQVHRTLNLTEPVRLRDYRAVRKLLEICSAELSLLSDGDVINGFGKFHGRYDQSEADLYEIWFARHHTWELVHGEHRLMRVTYGNPALPLPLLNERYFRSDVSRLFPGLTPEKIDHVLELANAACLQRHGALIVVARDAQVEAERLGRQCTRLTPVKLLPSMIRSVTAIDGAVLLNPDGICYAIGAILDGKATPEGDPSRGARFNSSLRYVSDRSECIAIVVSEDGTVEWIPRLRPQISRRKLESVLREAKEVLAAAEFNDSRSHRLLKWLRAHAFYLSAGACNLANELALRSNEARRAAGAIAVGYADLVPDPNMNATYLND